jgi:hypothetical protein
MNKLEDRVSLILKDYKEIKISSFDLLKLKKQIYDDMTNSKIRFNRNQL